jgi:hypothetical protein
MAYSFASKARDEVPLEKNSRDQGNPCTGTGNRITRLTLSHHISIVCSQLTRFHLRLAFLPLFSARSGGFVGLLKRAELRVTTR